MKKNDDPVMEINPRPKNIVETNIVPILLLVGLLVVLIIGLMSRPDSPQKKEEKEDQKVAVVVRTDESVKQFWFNDDAHKNIQINPSEAVNSPAAVQRSEKNLVNAQETKYRQTVVELEYVKKLELAQMEQKHELEEKEMEYAAMKAPLDLKTGSPMFRPSVENTGKSAGGSLANDSPRSGAVNSALPSIAFPKGDEKPDENRQDAKEAFVQREGKDQDYLAQTKKPPISPYELKAGTYIPAALLTGIQSDLPGPIVAQVTANVYDTASGQYLLIPQGAKLVGEYDSHVSFGQNRALVVWTRLVFPDGATLNLSRMQGVDMAGYAGFYDKVDNHYLRIYGNAFMLSLVGAGYELLNKKTSSTNAVSAQDTVAASVGQRLADVSSQTMERNMSVQPTIVIRPGYKFNIVVVKDVILENMNNDAP